MDLVPLSRAKDNAARWRACQLLHVIMASLPSDVALADDVADAVQDAMLERLDDSRPSVKAAAVRALARLPDPGNTGDFSDCPVTAALLDLLSSEKTKDVRRAVLASLPASLHTKPQFLDRTRDEADEVRRIMYLAIAEKLPLQALSSDERALLIQRGLGDRCASVSDAARSMLETWLEVACGGEPLTLLRALSVQHHPKEAEMALTALVESGRLDAVKIGRLAAEENVGLRGAFTTKTVASREGSPLAADDDNDMMCIDNINSLLAPEAALFWRVICEWLSSDAASKGLAALGGVGTVATIDGAAAAERLEALEAALPATVEELVDIVALHINAGPQHRFAAGQLMHLMAQCADFADASGRRAAANLLTSTLLSSHSSSSSSDSNDVEYEEWNDSWTTAVTLLLKKVYSSPSELADAMLTTLGLIIDQAFNPTNPQDWLHFLNVTAVMLTMLPSARPALRSSSFSLHQLVTAFLLPATAHADKCVRALAVRCLGLYAMLDGIPTKLAEHVGTLRCRLLSGGEDSSVKAVAAQALADLALQRGPKAMDAISLVATVGGDASQLQLQQEEKEDGDDDVTNDEERKKEEKEAGVMSNNNGDPTIDPELLQAPLGDVFLHSLHIWREGFSDLKKTASLEEVEQAASLGTALTEGLAKLALINEFRKGSDQARQIAPTAFEEGEMMQTVLALLLTAFDPVTERASRLRQALFVFFERFARISLVGQQYLATALLPAARTALLAEMNAAVEQKGKYMSRLTAADTMVTTQLMKFVLQLLQLPVSNGPSGGVEPHGHEPLGEMLLGDALSLVNKRTTPKAYLATLCRLPLGLPTCNSDSQACATAARCAIIAGSLAGRVMDKVLRKDLLAVEEKYWTAAGGEEAKEQLTEENITALLEAVRTHVQMFTADYSLPCDQEEEDCGDYGEEGGRRRRVATRRTRAAADNDNEEEEESPSKEEGEEEALPPPRVKATRATRVTKSMKEAPGPDSEEEEEEDNAVEVEEESISDEEEEEEDSDNGGDVLDYGEEVEEHVVGVVGGDNSEEDEDEDEENLRRTSSLSKTRRASVESVAALRKALTETVNIQD